MPAHAGMLHRSLRECCPNPCAGCVDYLVDTLALYDHVGPALKGVFADPNIVKVCLVHVRLCHAPMKCIIVVMQQVAGMHATLAMSGRLVTSCEAPSALCC